MAEIWNLGVAELRMSAAFCMGFTFQEQALRARLACHRYKLYSIVCSNTAEAEISEARHPGQCEQASLISSAPLCWKTPFSGPRYLLRPIAIAPVNLLYTLNLPQDEQQWKSFVSSGLVRKSEAQSCRQMIFMIET